MSQLQHFRYKVFPLFSLLLLLSSCNLFLREENGGISKDAMEAMIASNIPKGTSQEKVLEFLESKKIHHTTEEYIDYETNGNPRKLPMVTASIRNNMPSFFESHLGMVFYFNEAGLLERYEVRQSYKTV